MRSLTIGLTVLALASAAHGGTIYDNGSPPPSGIHTYFAESGVDGYSAEAADNFSLADGASTIRDIHWWGTYAFGVTDDDFTVTIYNQGAAAAGPGIPAAVATILTLERTISPIGDLGLYFYSATVADIALEPDTTYWLGITNASGTGWGWTGTQQPGNLHQRGTGPWFSTDAALAFYLTDDVPAPGALALVVPAGLIVARRRR